MRIVTDTISLADLRVMDQGLFGNLVKGVVDVNVVYRHWMPNCIPTWKQPSSRTDHSSGISGASTCIPTNSPKTFWSSTP